MSPWCGSALLWFSFRATKRAENLPLLYSRALNPTQSHPPPSPPIKGGELISLPWREGLGEET
jgi:hypothetical protein